LVSDWLLQNWTGSAESDLLEPVVLLQDKSPANKISFPSPLDCGLDMFPGLHEGTLMFKLKAHIIKNANFITISGENRGRDAK
jgi:hypothetical protein